MAYWVAKPTHFSLQQHFLTGVLGDIGPMRYTTKKKVF